MNATTLDARIVHYELEIAIEADREVVWSALTEETDAWWLPDFHMVGEGSVVRFDARAGGQLIETREDGGSLLWYTVQMCSPGESVHLAGHVFPQWGGPATTLLHLSLEQDGGKTVLRVHDAQHGQVSDENIRSLEEGWALLFTEGLKKYVEAAQETGTPSIG